MDTNVTTINLHMLKGKEIIFFSLGHMVVCVRAFT